MMNILPVLFSWTSCVILNIEFIGIEQLQLGFMFQEHSLNDFLLQKTTN